ncbi:MAG: ankyrin repeat domain-containing protein [Candidatus Latescibacteria bacterium]|nr:ankyrin repeat domain-containing protein [Candidatus Latescibacterota bacterium]
MFKGRLLRALTALDPDEVSFCIDQEPDLLHLRRPNDLGLLQLAASVETRNKSDIITQRQIAIIDGLVHRGLDIHYVDETRDVCDRVNLVWFAVARGRNIKVAKHLLDAGVKPDGLFAAGWWEDVSMIVLLGSYAMDVNPVVFNETPLLHCLKNGKYGSLDPLITIGADVNWQDHRGQTVLHHAMRKKVDTHVFQSLLRAGADPDLPDQEGRTARDVASRKRDGVWSKAIQVHSGK